MPVACDSRSSTRAEGTRPQVPEETTASATAVLAFAETTEEDTGPAAGAEEEKADARAGVLAARGKFRQSFLDARRG